MSRRSFVEELEYGNAEGMDTTSPISDVKPGFVRKALNTNLDEAGGWEKRGGFKEQLTSAWTGLSIRQGIQFITDGGIDRLVLFGTDDTGDARLGFDSAGSITEIITGLAADKRPTFVQFDDRLMLYNDDISQTPFIYDGTTTRPIGISQPASAPILVGAIGGNLILTASYVYAYSYIRRIDGQLKAESTPSPVASITLAGAQNQVDMTLVPSAESGTTNIRIYRTGADGSQLFLLTEIGNVAAFSDTLTDANLTTPIELDNSKITQFTSNPAFPIIVQNRVFLKSGENEIRFSKNGVDGPLPESFEVSAVVNTESTFGDSDRVVGIGKVKDLPLIIKERSIGRLDAVGTPDRIGVSTDTVNYLYKELDTSTTAVGNWAGTEVLGEYVWLGKDNIYATNGQSVRTVGDPIQSTIRRLIYTADRAQKISAITDTQNRQIKFSVFTDSGQQEPNLTLVGDYKQYPKFRWTLHSEGQDSTLWPGQRIGSFFKKINPINGAIETFFGNTDGNGQYYSTEDGTDDNGSPIFFELETRPYFMGRPMLDKLYKTVQALAQTTQPEVILEMCVIYDLTGVEERCVEKKIPAIGGKWDDGTGMVGNTWAFDDPNSNLANVLVWSGEALERLDSVRHRKAKFQQLIFRQSEKDKPVQMIGWGTSGSIFGQSDETT